MALARWVQRPTMRSRKAMKRSRTAMNLKALVGSGDKIGLVVLPFLIIGLILNAAFPSAFEVAVPRTPYGSSRSWCWPSESRSGSGPSR